MRKHNNIEVLADYVTEEISETIKVVNPEYRTVDDSAPSCNQNK
jgi:hypothetical protein